MLNGQVMGLGGPACFEDPHACCAGVAIVIICVPIACAQHVLQCLLNAPLTIHEAKYWFSALCRSLTCPQGHAEQILAFLLLLIVALESNRNFILHESGVSKCPDQRFSSQALEQRGYHP